MRSCWVPAVCAGGDPPGLAIRAGPSDPQVTAQRHHLMLGVQGWWDLMNHPVLSWLVSDPQGNQRCEVRRALTYRLGVLGKRVDASTLTRPVLIDPSPTLCSPSWARPPIRLTWCSPWKDWPPACPRTLCGTSSPPWPPDPHPAPPAQHPCTVVPDPPAHQR